MPHDSPRTLVLWHQNSRRNSKIPPMGATNAGGVG